MSSAKSANRFPGVVAHGVHSFTVEALQEFKPTVNMDLASEPAILPYAPHGAQADQFFKTEGLRMVDRVLSHMDDSLYNIKQYSGLERLVHALHMREVWHCARDEYRKLHSNPPSNEVCRCAMDLENNGILKMLRLSALEIREPSLMYGKEGVKYPFIYMTFVRTTNADGTLRQANESIPQLKNEDDWAFWKGIMKRMRPSDDYELALFLYCALEK